jgi:ADP-ribose pyrophosphatase
MGDASPLVRIQATPLSPWVTLMSKEVVLPGMSRPEAFHSLRQADYVTILGVTPAGEIPLVRQYRPAIERESLELPGGLRDGDEAPLETAIREFAEETGYRVAREPVLLGRLVPDSGRLENCFWCYFAELCEAPDTDWRPEPQVERVVMGKGELRAALCDGRFEHALHIGLIGLAVTRGVFAWD